MFAFQSHYYPYHRYLLLPQMQTFPHVGLAYPQIPSPLVDSISMPHLFLPLSLSNLNNPTQADPHSIQSQPPHPNERLTTTQTAERRAQVSQQYSKGSQGVEKSVKQKFGRNINSNIFHLMVKFIKKERNLKAKVSKIIQLNKMVLSTHEFYQIFKNKSAKLKSYATHRQIMDFWTGPDPEDIHSLTKLQKQLEAAGVFRILGRLYLQTHHLPYLFNSTKTKAASRRLHLQALRSFAAQ